MAANVTIPRADIPAVDQDAFGRFIPSRDLYRWMRDITARVGGATGAGTNDLSISTFEDAGIEELRSGLYAARDEYLQAMPVDPQPQIEALQTECAELRETVAELVRAIQAINQGTIQ